jgi:hypothetical protein
MGKIKAVIEMVTGETKIELVPDWMEYIDFIEMGSFRTFHLFDPLLPVSATMTRRRFKMESVSQNERRWMK